MRAILDPPYNDKRLYNVLAKAGFLLSPAALVSVSLIRRSPLVNSGMNYCNWACWLASRQTESNRTFGAAAATAPPDDPPVPAKEPDED